MLIKIKTFSGETLYIPEEDYLDEVMYSDLEEREFAKNSIRYTKKVIKSALNEGLKSAAKTGTPQISNATQQRLLRVNGGKAKNLMTVPEQFTIGSKGIKKNYVRRIGADPRVLKKEIPNAMDQMRKQAKHTTNFINNAPDRNKAIAQVRSNARDVVRNGGLF